MSAADLLSIAHGHGLGSALIGLAAVALGRRDKPIEWLVGAGFYGLIGAVLALATR